MTQTSDFWTQRAYLQGLSASGPKGLEPFYYSIHPYSKVNLPDIGNVMRNGKFMLTFTVVFFLFCVVLFNFLLLRGKGMYEKCA
jgi:hypothetical protein